MARISSPETSSRKRPAARTDTAYQPPCALPISKMNGTPRSGAAKDIKSRSLSKDSSYCSKRTTSSAPSRRNPKARDHSSNPIGQT